MKFVCYKCQNEFASKFTLTRHVESCKDVLSEVDVNEMFINTNKELEKYKKEIYTLKEQNIDDKSNLKIHKKENTRLNNVIIEKDLVIEKQKKENGTLKKEIESQKVTIKDQNKLIKDLQEQLQNSQKIINSHVNSHNMNNSNNVNIIIQVLPIDKLNLDYIKKEDLQVMFDKLNKDQSGNMELVLKNYIRSILSNPDHPENHAVKYTKKDPPMFSTLVTENDTQKHVVNDLKDTCDLISEPLIEHMMKKIKSSWREFCQDPDFDETMDINLMDALKDKLKNENVRKILKRYLRSDILENVQMKIEKTTIQPDENLV